MDKTMKTIIRMKELIIAVALALVLNLGFDSCIATRDTTKINKVEMGMNKSDIHIPRIPNREEMNTDAQGTP